MATKTKLNVRPMADRVFVKLVAEDEVTAGGVILPDTAKEKPQRGEVVAVGKGRTSDTGEVIKPTVKVGDIVLFGKYGGSEVTLEGVEYKIFRESDIMAIIG